MLVLAGISPSCRFNEITLADLEIVPVVVNTTVCLFFYFLIFFPVWGQQLEFFYACGKRVAAVVEIVIFVNAGADQPYLSTMSHAFINSVDKCSKLNTSPCILTSWDSLLPSSCMPGSTSVHASHYEACPDFMRYTQLLMFQAFTSFWGIIDASVSV